MPQFVRPPTAEVPYGGSFGDVFHVLGRGIQDYMARRDYEEEMRRKRKAEDVAAAVAGEDRLLSLAPVLSMFDESKTTPMFEPASPELGLPERKVADVPLGPQLAEPLLSEITLPDGRKVPIPPVRGMREQLGAEANAAARAEAEKGTEVLTQEAWDKLPEFYKARWRPGQRLNSSTVGALGLEVFRAANAKALADAAATERKTLEGRKAPQSRTVAGRVQEWNPDTKAWTDVGSAKAPGEEKPDMVWVTDTATKQRVRVSQKDVDAAPPGKYTDIRPTQAGGVSSTQMRDSTSAALKVLGSSDGTVKDSIWQLAKKLSVPANFAGMGPSVMGPVGKVAGWGTSFAAFLKASPDAIMYRDQVAGFIPLFARAVGHSGVLTEKDVRRTELLFPEPGDTDEVVTRKLTRLENIMSRKEQMPQGIWDPQPGFWPPGSSTGEDLSPDAQDLLNQYGGGQ